MDDTEFLSILADADAGLDPGVGWKTVHLHATTLIAERDALIDVAAGAAILLGQIEWEGARPRDISMLREALDRHQQLREGPQGVKQPDSPIVIMNDPTHRPIEG